MLANPPFGYYKITVERPLRLNFQATEERIARIDEETGFKNLATSNKKNEKQRLEEIAAGEKRQQDNYPNRIIPDLIYRLRIRADTNGDFVCWFLLSRLGRAQIECDARGSSGSMVKLGQGHVRAWNLPFPPIREQAAIAAYLDKETANLDKLMAKVETVIERLQEYRTALITAAVTGKIDVRKEVA